MARRLLPDEGMAARKRRSRDAVRVAGSWMALLAATTLGGDVAAESVHAVIKAGVDLDGDTFRLIVQSYDAGALRGGALRAGRAKPVGSMQRVVSAEELKEGIRVDFVELRDGELRDARERPLVVAWLEAATGPLGHDYDLDAREARPSPGSVCGFAHRSAPAVAINLNRRA